MSSDTDCEDDTLKTLIEYFYKGSLKFSLEKKDIEKMTWARQKTFLDRTVFSELLKKYPVNSEFCRMFFKKLIGYLESQQEVHDDIFNYLCSIMRKEKYEEDFSYRHYVVDNALNSVVTIKETNHIVVNGTTGMRTWEAALMLADFALCNRNLFDNRKVLELGSGVGFTGITIAKFCNSASITMTDCSKDVLRAICDNIKINFPQLHQQEIIHQKKFFYEQTSIEAMLLDWQSTEDLPSSVVPDIVIGADIVYDPTIIQPLCNTLKILLERNNQLEVYIVNIIRNEDTINLFLKTLGKYA